MDARKVEIIGVIINEGDDSWTVVGKIDGVDVTAVSHLSAVTNFYPKEAYKSDGHFVGGAKPRLMTAAEAVAGAEQLIKDQNPAPPVMITVEQALKLLSDYAARTTAPPPPAVTPAKG